MSSSQHIVKVIDVVTLKSRPTEQIVVVEAPDIHTLWLHGFWYFDPISGGLWEMTTLGLPNPPNPTREVVGLVPVGGNGKLVPGLDLHLVPIGWQP